jgi:hypothetical protein
MDILADAFGITEKHNSDVAEYKFYNGTETVYFDRAAHVYSRYVHEEYVVVPGATTITDFQDKPFLVPWAAKMTAAYVRNNFQFDKLYTVEELEELLALAKRNFRDYTERAAETGSIAHDWIERYIKAKIANRPHDEALPEDERAANGVRSFLNWEAENHVQWLASERKIYSLKYGFAGTMDALAIVNGVMAVIDFKTSNHLHRLSYGMQTAAYQAAQMEELGLDIQERWILRLSKVDAEFETMHLGPETFQHDFTCFLSLLDAYTNIQFHEQMEREAREEAKAEAKAVKDAAKLKEKEDKAFAKAQEKLVKEQAKLLKVKTPRRKKAA